jgi:hypothetical protein
MPFARANRDMTVPIGRSVNIRNLTIGELFEFAQNQYFAQSARHHNKNRANRPRFCFAYQCRFRIVGRADRGSHACNSRYGCLATNPVNIGPD